MISGYWKFFNLETGTEIVCFLTLFHDSVNSYFALEIMMLLVFTSF